MSVRHRTKITVYQNFLNLTEFNKFGVKRKATWNWIWNCKNLIKKTKFRASAIVWKSKKRRLFEAYHLQSRFFRDWRIRCKKGHDRSLGMIKTFEKNDNLIFDFKIFFDEILPPHFFGSVVGQTNSSTINCFVWLRLYNWNFSTYRWKISPSLRYALFLLAERWLWLLK